MRRAIVAVLGTAAGTTLLVGLKTGVMTRPAAATPAASVAPVDGDRAGTEPGGDAPPGPARSGNPAGYRAEPGGGPATPGGVVQPSAGAKSAPAGRPAPSVRASAGAGVSRLRDGAFTGSAVPNQYGTVQVRITVSGGRIAEVTATRLPNGEPRSVEINARAAPVLRQQALTAQSANVQTVSGATYTSKGYKTSLQAALDAAARR